MKDLKKLSLNREVKREAEEIEKEVESRSDLDNIKVSDNMETSLFNKIQEYEYDKRLKKVHYRRKRRYLIVALAAVIVLVCGSVMTGVGSKSYWKVIWERITGDGPTEITNVEDMESQPTEDLDEIGVYKEINECFGISIVRLGYKPQNTILQRYILDDEQNKAYLFYKYNNEILRYTMYMNNTDSSFGQKDLDQLLQEYKIENNNYVINIQEYKVEGSKENRYIAEFEYRDVHYQLAGVLGKDEFDKILKNLIFL
ncbi:MAG: DUF4367 domain-containing protein [Mediterraneibacter sp.]